MAAFLSIVPDLDFILVWGLGLPISVYHRTFSHSVLFGLALALLWPLLRPARMKALSFVLVFWILLSHGFIDMICTADAADHGVMLLWPLSTARLGWPVLVPLYRTLGDSPFSLEGALRFTGLEIVLAAPLWWLTRLVRDGFTVRRTRPWRTEMAAASPAED